MAGHTAGAALAAAPQRGERVSGGNRGLALAADGIHLLAVEGEPATIAFAGQPVAVGT
jgi:hypothetical protein